MGDRCVGYLYDAVSLCEGRLEIWLEGERQNRKLSCQTNCPIHCSKAVLHSVMESISGREAKKIHNYSGGSFVGSLCYAHPHYERIH